MVPGVLGVLVGVAVVSVYVGWPPGPDSAGCTSSAHRELDALTVVLASVQGGGAVCVHVGDG